MSTSPNRMLGIIFGVIYLLLGVFGFFVTSSVAFTGTSNSIRLLGMFELNPLQNLLHLAVGVILLLTGLIGIRTAKGVNTVLGAVFLIAGIIGVFLAASGPNVLAINAADNVLHFLTAVLLLAVGLGAEKSVEPAKA